MQKPDYVTYFLEKSQEPDFDFSSMRKEMEKNGVPEQDIKIIIGMVDDAILRREVVKSKSGWGPQSGMSYIVLGIAVTLVGIVVTFGTFFGIIDTGNSFILAYGGLLGGPATIFFGISKRHKDRSAGTIKKRWQQAH